MGLYSIFSGIVTTIFNSFIIDPIKNLIFQFFSKTRIEKIQYRSAPNHGLNFSDGSQTKDFIEIFVNFSTEKKVVIDEIRLSNVEIIQDYFVEDLNFQHGLNPHTQIFSICAINNGSKTILLNNYTFKHLKGWWGTKRHKPINSEKLPFTKIKAGEIILLLTKKINSKEILKNFDSITQGQTLLLQLYDENEKLKLSYPAPYNISTRQFHMRPMGGASQKNNIERNIFKISKPYHKSYNLKVNNCIDKDSPILNFYILFDQTARLKFNIELYSNNKLIKFKKGMTNTLNINIFKPYYKLKANDKTGLHGNIYQLLDKHNVIYLDKDIIEQYHPELLYKNELDN